MTKRNAVTILQRSRQVLIDKGLTKGAYARNSRGRECEVNDPDAQCFCALGAFAVGLGTVTSKWGHKHDSPLPIRGNGLVAAQALSLAMAPPRTPSFNVWVSNDKPATTPEQVLVAFDFAIEFAKDWTKKRKA
jgi:hypothetical protein